MDPITFYVEDEKLFYQTCNGRVSLTEEEYFIFAHFVDKIANRLQSEHDQKMRKEIEEITS